MIVLDKGKFFGREVAAARVGDFVLTETQFARGAFLPWHTHTDPYLTFVLNGGYRERLKSATRPCAARSVVLHPAGDTHEDDFDGPARCLNVVLAPSFAARMPPFEGVVTSDVVANIGRRLSEELRRADSAAGLIVEGLLLELFGVLLRRDDDRPTAPAWLHEARSIIERNFATKLGLGELATTVGVHPVHLARSFRQHYGLSVGEHVRALRIAAAREQIAAGITLETVAMQAGFADQSHFTRAFKRAVGVAPAEYRRKLRR